MGKKMCTKKNDSCKRNNGKESMQETKVTTGKRSTHMNARKHAQREAIVGGITTRAWEKNLT